MLWLYSWLYPYNGMRVSCELIIPRQGKVTAR
jgi:hypothetical protein